VPPAATTLLVDLDGTLLDTAPDMGAALNRVRAEEGLPPLSAAVMRPQISHGAAGLIRLGFPTVPDLLQAGLRERFVNRYREALADHGTALFQGFAEVLAALAESGRPWGIVTNKPGWLTEPLLERLALTHRPAVTISGDTTAARKPDPLPITTACEILKVAPIDCLYLGDAERDVTAGRRAGTQTAVALWGYLDAGEAVSRWGADHLVGHPFALGPLLGLTL
jgi:phosphoglycolate phosphatase